MFLENAVVNFPNYYRLREANLATEQQETTKAVNYNHGCSQKLRIEKMDIP